VNISHLPDETLASPNPPPADAGVIADLLEVVQRGEDVHVRDGLAACNCARMRFARASAGDTARAARS
jgi:hypothetical protein